MVNTLDYAANAIDLCVNDREVTVGNVSVIGSGLFINQYSLAGTRDRVQTAALNEYAG